MIFFKKLDIPKDFLQKLLDEIANVSFLSYLRRYNDLYLKLEEDIKYFGYNNSKIKALGKCLKDGLSTIMPIFLELEK